MSHEISVVDGRAETFNSVVAPWHGLGTILDHVATAREAIEAAHLGWSVEKRPVMFPGADGSPTGFPGRNVTVRTDNLRPLGIVGGNYEIVQNSEAFAFLDSVVGEGQAIYESAGALYGGAKIWMLTRIPGDIEIGPDAVRRYILLSTGHDGGSALTMRFTPVRVVCANTLSAAVRGTKSAITLHHIGGIAEKISQAQRALGLAVRYYDDVAGQFRQLAASMVGSRERLTEYVDEVFPCRREEVPTRTQNIRAEVVNLFDSGRGHQVSGVRGTWWAAYNAVAEYVDHSRGTRSSAKSDGASNRLNSIWFGSGADVKTRAFELAMDAVS